MDGPTPLFRRLRRHLPPRGKARSEQMPSLPVILRSNATKDLKGKCKIEDDFIFRDPFDCAAHKLGLPKIAAERDFWERGAAGAAGKAASAARRLPWRLGATRRRGEKPPPARRVILRGERTAGFPLNQVKAKGTRPERRLLRALRLILIAIPQWGIAASSVAPIHRKMRSFRVRSNRKRVDCLRCKAKTAGNTATY